MKIQRSDAAAASRWTGASLTMEEEEEEDSDSDRKSSSFPSLSSSPSPSPSPKKDHTGLRVTEARNCAVRGDCGCRGPSPCWLGD